jgi:hypothetical protein
MQFINAWRIDLALAALVALTSACSPDASTGLKGSSTNRADRRTPQRALASSQTVFTLQLRALPPNPILPPSPIFGYGHLQLRLGATLDDSCLPPNPISPQPGFTALSVCGKIFNEGGALYTGGGIYAVSGGLGDTFNPVLVASFNAAQPGSPPISPCRRYEVAGFVAVPDAVAADMLARTTSYAVLFDGDVGGSATRIGGRFDGSAWGPVGQRPETDPFFAEKVCSVAVTP